MTNCKHNSIADLLNDEEAMLEVAKQAAEDQRMLMTTLRKLRQAGVDLPKRRGGTGFQDAVEELKSKQNR